MKNYAKSIAQRVGVTCHGDPKNQNAITLVALVITIIVLLILAGVALSLVMGENGITERAVNAGKIQNIAGAKEKVELEVANLAGGFYQAKYVNGEAVGDIKAYILGKLGNGDGYTISQGSNTGDIILTISDGTKVTGNIDDNGKVTWGGVDTNSSSGGDTIDNSQSLVLALVDDLGTRSTIYLYNNTDKITEGNITITMPDNSEETIVAQADTSEIVYDSSVNKYATYTVAKNGTYEFQATDGNETTTTTVVVNNIEQFTSIETLASEQGLSYAGGKTNAYTYKGAVVPKGYYVDTKSNVATGLVVTDNVDSEGYSTGNEWVWVPVNSTVGNDDYYGEESSATALAGATSVTYTKYSKLYSFLDKTRESYGTFHPYGTTTGTLSRPSTTSSPQHREIAILTNNSYGETGKYNLVNNRANGTAFANVTDVATQYRDDYESMVASVDNYKGFYIGRYEITSNGVKPGSSLTNTNWYTFYNQSLTYGTDYTESGMIYGCLWDATMQWLTTANYSVGYTGNTYSGYGNYNSEAVKVNNEDVEIIVKEQDISQRLQTGQTSYTESNNIYDLSGNCLDWTQEASATTYRVSRGRRLRY